MINFLLFFKFWYFGYKQTSAPQKFYVALGVIIKFYMHLMMVPWFSPFNYSVVLAALFVLVCSVTCELGHTVVCIMSTGIDVLDMFLMQKMGFKFPKLESTLTSGNQNRLQALHRKIETQVENLGKDAIIIAVQHDCTYKDVLAYGNYLMLQLRDPNISLTNDTKYSNMLCILMHSKVAPIRNTRYMFIVFLVRMFIMYLLYDLEVCDHVKISLAKYYYKALNLYTQLNVKSVEEESDEVKEDAKKQSQAKKLEIQKLQKLCFDLDICVFKK